MSEEATLAQLRQSLGLLQVAFDAASEAMVIVEPGGEVRWGNQAAADLWTNGLAILLVGRPLEQLLQPITTGAGISLAARRGLRVVPPGTVRSICAKLLAMLSAFA